MRVITYLCTAVILLAGCASTEPTCGTPAAQGVPCTNSFASMLTEFNATQPPPRNYFTTPFVGPTPQPVQPNFGNTANDRYQSIMINTPNGMVMKQCRVLNERVVSCF